MTEAVKIDKCTNDWGCKEGWMNERIYKAHRWTNERMYQLMNERMTVLTKTDGLVDERTVYHWINGQTRLRIKRRVKGREKKIDEKMMKVREWVTRAKPRYFHGRKIENGKNRFLTPKFTLFLASTLFQLRPQFPFSLKPLDLPPFQLSPIARSRRPLPCFSFGWSFPFSRWPSTAFLPKPLFCILAANQAHFEINLHLKSAPRLPL